MSKRLDLTKLPRSERKTVSKVYADGEFEVDITLKEPRTSTLVYIGGETTAMMEQFAITDYIYPLGTGESVRINKPVISSILAVQLLQPGDEDEKYTFEQLLTIMNESPSIWLELQTVATELINLCNAKMGNSVVERESP